MIQVYKQVYLKVHKQVYILLNKIKEKNGSGSRRGYSLMYTIFYVSIGILIISTLISILSSLYRMKFLTNVDIELSEVAFDTKDRMCYDLDFGWGYKFYNDQYANSGECMVPDNGEYVEIKSMKYQHYDKIDSRSVVTSTYSVNPGGNLYILYSGGRYQLANYVRKIEVKKREAPLKGYQFRITYGIKDSNRININGSYYDVEKGHINSKIYSAEYVDEFCVYPLK